MLNIKGHLNILIEADEIMELHSSNKFYVEHICCTLKKGQSLKSSDQRVSCIVHLYILM